MNPSSGSAPEFHWLAGLLEDVHDLPASARPSPYWSQRRGAESPLASWTTVVHRVRVLIENLETQHFFAQTLGYNCVDGNGDTTASPQSELEERVGKPELYDAPDDDWPEADLCDFIEVFHDLAARPTSGWVHDYAGCGFHPDRFSRNSGQALYRWQINRLLERSPFDLRIAEAGEDTGRMVRVAPAGLDALVDETRESAPATTQSEIGHAVALFRGSRATREEKRSAIVALARLLEDERALLEGNMSSNDEGALFQIANRFDLRHKDGKQLDDYGDEYLDWIFYWYLATVNLIGDLRAREEADQSGTPG